MTSGTQPRTAVEVAALRKLDLISPEQVVRWAGERAAEREASTEVIELATLYADARADDVDPLLDRLLEAEGTPPLDDERAGLIAANLVAQDIIEGTIEPFVGARKLWWDVARRVPAMEDRLVVFIGLASEWEDNPHHRDAYDRDIISAARDLIANSYQP